MANYFLYTIAGRSYIKCKSNTNSSYLVRNKRFLPAERLPRVTAERLGGEVVFFRRMATLHTFLDEAGTLDFSRKSSKYYVFTVVWTYEPKPLADNLTRLRFDLLKQGHDISGFHAYEDNWINRQAVLSTIVSDDSWRYAAVVVEKAKVNPSLRKPHVFYPKFATMPLKFVLKGQIRPDTTTCMIITDTIPVNKHKKSVEKAIKMSCRSELPPTIPFHCYHHPSVSNKWLQVADYCCWAVQRKWEQSDDDPYNQLRPRLAAPELDVLATVTTRYF